MEKTYKRFELSSFKEFNKDNVSQMIFMIRNELLNMSQEELSEETGIALTKIKQAENKGVTATVGTLANIIENTNLNSYIEIRIELTSKEDKKDGVTDI